MPLQGTHRDWWDPEGQVLGWGQGQRSLCADLTCIHLDKRAGSSDCPGQRLHCLSKLRREAPPARDTGSRGRAPHHHPLPPSDLARPSGPRMELRGPCLPAAQVLCLSSHLRDPSAVSQLRISTPKTSHHVGDGGHLALISPSIAASEALETACPGGLSGPAATQSLSRDQSVPAPPSEPWRMPTDPTGRDTLKSQRQGWECCGGWGDEGEEVWGQQWE